MGLIKKIIFITTFIAVFGWLLGGNIQTTKAQTMEELSAQITVLRNQIAEYQKKIAELQAEIVKLLGKQIALVQNQIAQLQAAKPTKPESEYNCPDVNRTGTVDLADLTLLNKAFGTCQGSINYDPKADFDGDNCVTATDQAFLNKYYGKKTSEISQCKGVVIPPRSPKPESEYKCPDLNGNGTIDLPDTVIISTKINTCEGETNYDPKGDINGDGCITDSDLNFVNKYYGKKTTEISQCGGVVVTPIPESEYSCPDIDGTGVIDLTDLTLLSKALGSCQGGLNYNDKANFDGDNCVTSTDQAFLQKYYGKKTTEIAQCGAVITTSTLSVGLSANPSSGNAPLSGVDLTASISGTASGNINYTFYCNRSDSGTNIIAGWCQKKDSATQASYIATDCCNFYAAGTYTVKVIAERESLQAEARKTIQVNPPLSTSTKLESEYKCPDLNGDGTVNLPDTVIISIDINSCKGATNFNEKGDVDWDGCITTNDSSFVNKYYGKKTTEISQCGGVVVTPIPESEYSCPDIDGTGVIDLTDLTLLSKALGSCQGGLNYNDKANFDGDNCVTSTDQAFLQKYYGKTTTEISQCR